MSLLTFLLIQLSFFPAFQLSNALSIFKQPLSCPAKHEQFSQCSGHCQPTCAVPQPICTLQCTPGCVCQPSFIRKSFPGPCVPISHCQCPSKAEVFSQCGAHCQATCDNRTPACPKLCSPGCVCKPGFIRLKPDGPCIQDSLCPSKKLCLNANEVFSACSGHCQATCTVPFPICTLQCSPGCVCRSGFVRDSEGRCIPMSKCPKKQCSGMNEVFSACGGHCQGTCDVPLPKCTKQCTPGCVCQPGYIRESSKGRCIPISGCEGCKANCKTWSPGCNSCPCYNNVFATNTGECSDVRCFWEGIPHCVERCKDENEYYTDCGTCENDCSNADTPLYCRMACQKKCVCKKGYVREIPGGKCVLKTDCPVNKTASIWP